MSQNEMRAFQSKLAFHTAPSLLGIKCASLVAISKSECNVAENVLAFNLRAARKGLKITALSECREKTLILVYNRAQLSQRLREADSREILRRYGYTDDMTVEDCIERLSERMRGGGDFPHEIGIFLGYPTEDVIGFIANNGGSFKLCGYWKVYGNERRAERTFENYNKCRNYLCRKLDMGEDFYRILKIS